MCPLGCAINNLELVFWICAVASTIFFVLRVILMLSGIGHHDIGGVDHSGGDMSDSDVAFEFFSIHSVTAFFMMFGWVGLACYNYFIPKNTIAVVWATLAGIISMVITASVFRGARRLTSRGAQFMIENTVGKRALVYLAIPPQGRGKIQITLEGDITREIEAISVEDEEINSFQTVEIVKVVDAHTVAVKKI